MAVIETPPVIHASLNHLSDNPLWQDEKPYEIWMDKVPPGTQRTNVTFDTIHQVPLVDIRSLGSNGPSLDKEGFEVIHHCLRDVCELDSVDEVNRPEKRQIVREYLNTMTKVLVDRFNGKKAVCYDWRVRRSKEDAYVTIPRIYFMDLPEDAEVREHKIDVSHNIHGGMVAYNAGITYFLRAMLTNTPSDGSPDGIKKQLTYLLTEDEQADLVSGRYRLRVVNIWRPISPIVETEPLAFCDVRTVSNSDWEPVEKIFENWIEESMYLKRNENHKWFWLSKQRKDEVSIFTVWDSNRPDEPSMSTPHSSVILPEPFNGTKARESIEMRMLLWTDL